MELKIRNVDLIAVKKIVGLVKKHD